MEEYVIVISRCICALYVFLCPVQSNKKGELEFWHPGSVMKKPQWKTYTFEVLRGVYFLKHKVSNCVCLSVKNL